MKAVVTLVGSAVLLAASSAFGQGLLALSQGGSDYKQNVPLTMDLEVGGGYDNVHYSDPSQQNTNSFFLQGGVGLIYSHNDPTTKFSVGADFDTLYYFQDVGGQNTFYNTHALVNFSQQINRRLSVTDNLYLGYEMQPDYSIGASSSLANGQYLYGYNNFAVTYAWSERVATTTGWTIEGIHYDDSAQAQIDDHLSNIISQQFIYKLNRRTSLVAEYRFETSNFKQGASANLASPDYTAHYALIGVDEAWSPKLNFSVRGGAEIYLSDRSDKTAPYFESSLTYALSRTTSIRWYNQLGFDPSELDDYNARYSYRTGIIASRQFTERLTGNASINYVHSDFEGNDVVASGNDNEINACVGVDYKLWRHVTLKANYSFTTISSDIDFRDYTRNYATLLLNATFEQPTMTPANSELQRHALDYWQIARNRLGLIFLTFLVVFVAAALITYIMPRKFRGRVEMVIERNDEDVRVEGHQSELLNSQLTDGFFKTQFESITKRMTLDRVVDKLNLQKRWGLPTRQAALAKPCGNLNPESNIKSDFISIEFYDEDAQLAADVANSIAESYKETRLEVDRNRSESAVVQLNAQITAKENTTNAALQKMIEIKKRLGIVEMPVLYPQRMAGQDAVPTLDSSTLVEAAQDVYKLKKDIRDMSAQIEQLRTLEGDDLIRQASDLRVENDTIRKLGPTYQDLLLKHNSLTSAGLGPKHPAVEGVAAELARTRTLLLEAAADYRKNLDTRIQIAQKQLVETQSLDNEQRGKSISDQASNQEYLKAKKEWEILEMELAKLKDTRMQKEIDQQMSKTPITIHQSAEAETAPYKPKVALNLGLGAIVGLFLGFGLAFFMEYLDTSVKSLDDVEHYLGVPVLAVVPRDVPVLPLACGQSADAEAYRILRTNLEFNRKDPDANCFSMVSGAAGEGKSTTLVNLAFVCAQAGYNTLIIDADMRRPRMHTFFNVENHHGLSSYLASNVPLEEAAIQTAVPNLFLMPSGITPTDSAGLLNSKRFTELLADVKSRFDLVLVDSPPILGVSDASVLAAAVDASIIVVQHRKLPRHMLMRVKQAVDQVGGSLMGVVMNQVDINSDATYGYYTRYYHYYNTPVVPAGSPAAARRKTKAKAKSVADATPNPEGAQAAPVRTDDVF